MQREYINLTLFDRRLHLILRKVGLEPQVDESITPDADSAAADLNGPLLTSHWWIHHPIITRRQTAEVMDNVAQFHKCSNLLFPCQDKLRTNK